MPPKIPPEIGLLLSLGVSLAVWLTAGVLLGRGADSAWGWYPWGTLGGSLVGIGGAAANIYQIVRRLDQDQEPAKSPKPDEASGANAKDDSSK
jgi:F0F1-type ATP synthase assembly protein I